MVLKRLFRGKADESPPPPALPPGLRVYAVGDVHGRLDLLDALLESIDRDAASATGDVLLVMVGDLVDRGPDSAGVIERLRTLSRSRAVRILMGNHEEIFLKALNGSREALRFLTRIGGRETLLSYAISQEEYDSTGYDELMALMLERVPVDHVTFLSGLEDRIELGDYLFVHAGIRPGVPIEDQVTSDLRWIREPFLSHMKPHPRFVIHGHSITDTVDEQPNRIGIDTGAFASNRLTAIALEGTDRWYLDT